jgi:oligopeptide/dipeptide ABC transporter ATP-binding protein
MTGGPPLLEVEDLRTWFAIKKGIFRKTVGHVRAVDGVSFTLEKGKTLALVGESGCGKTTVGRSILRLVEPQSGHVRFEGRELLGLSDEEMLPLRRQIQMVFQDPMTSLNPRMRVVDLVAEGIDNFRLASSPAERTDRVASVLTRVKMSPDQMGRFPHEFSGGQRQRIGIARALAVEPSLLVCDEAVSALDVSIQAQILNLLGELQDELGLSYLFITHDLSVVRYLADEVAVMYLGEIVEQGPVSRLFEEPAHPYTRGLLDAVPSADPSTERVRVAVLGDVPSPAHPPSGCRFHTRCPQAMSRCKVEAPPLVRLSSGAAFCHLLSKGVSSS